MVTYKTTLKLIVYFITIFTCFFNKSGYLIDEYKYKIEFEGMERIENMLRQVERRNSAAICQHLATLSWKHITSTLSISPAGRCDTCHDTSHVTRRSVRSSVCWRAWRGRSRTPWCRSSHRPAAASGGAQSPAAPGHRLDTHTRLVISGMIVKLV